MRNGRKMVGLAVVGVALTVGATGAHAGGKHCKKGKCHPTVKQGRMTGQGTVDSVYGRSHHVFRNSVCNSNKFPDLKVQWEGNRFDLKAYSSPLMCLDTPADEGQPKAGFDTIVGQGTGVLNGEAGATATFRFTDAGEPGRNDTATITIADADGNVVFRLDNAKIAVGGNHQAHRR